MSLAIQVKSGKKTYHVQLSKRRLLTILGVTLFLITSYYQPWQNKGIPSAFAQERILQKQTELAHESAALEEVRSQVQRELSALTMKMGELQGQLRRLEAYGKQLGASVALSEEESPLIAQAIPMGGPAGDIDEWPLVTDHSLLNELDAMLAQIKDQQNQLQVLESVMVHHHIDEARFIAGRPISTGWLASEYGIRRDPFNGSPTMHRGIDYAADIGTPVAVTGAGIVTHAGRRSGYGNLVEVDHGAGLRTRYAHLNAYHVSVGDVVTRGQLIGEVGQTGRATGPHVHYEVIENGRHINPVNYVLRRAPER